jgi:aquaporin Z
MTAAIAQSPRIAPSESLIRNWRIYAIDGSLLGLFMISACTFGALLEHPSSPLRHAIESNTIRRALGGLAMGLTAIGLIYSPWGKRSGAQMNPAMTLSFLRLGRIKLPDAAGYIGAQFIGGLLGVTIMAALLRPWLADPAVKYVATMPGRFGLLAAWLGEFAIALLMMTVVMAANKVPKVMPFTGCFAGILVALYITIEAPLSGMGLNPARTFSSAVFADIWTGWWIYFTAPVLGMFAAIELHRALGDRPPCGKFTHSSRIACFIGCECHLHHEKK